jgi:hypothetical protein
MRDPIDPPVLQRKVIQACRRTAATTPRQQADLLARAPDR